MIRGKNPELIDKHCQNRGRERNKISKLAKSLENPWFATNAKNVKSIQHFGYLNDKSFSPSPENSSKKNKN